MRRDTSERTVCGERIEAWRVNGHGLRLSVSRSAVNGIKVIVGRRKSYGGIHRAQGRLMGRRSAV
jgi:hypothetical protein